MVPGYTGFVPKMKNHYFGKRYAEDTTRSIAKFEHQSDKEDVCFNFHCFSIALNSNLQQRIGELRAQVAVQSGRLPPQGAKCPIKLDATISTNGLPLEQCQKDAAPYPEHHVYPKSVYRMSNDDPNKFLISGML